MDRLGDDFPIPCAGSTFDTFTVWIFWNPPGAYLDVEIYSDGMVDWFFKNDRTGECAGTREERVKGIPEEVFDRLAAIREAFAAQVSKEVSKEGSRK